MNLSGYFRVAKGGSSHVPSRGHDGMASRRGSLQPAASHVHQTGKIQTCASDNNKDCLGFEFEYQDAAGLCLAIMLHGKSANHCRPDLPTLQKRLLHARLCCVPDLHSKPVGCKVHARRAETLVLDHFVGTTTQMTPDCIGHSQKAGSLLGEDRILVSFSVAVERRLRVGCVRRTLRLAGHLCHVQWRFPCRESYLPRAQACSTSTAILGMLFILSATY
jgi:hypothetical protein